MIETTNWNEPCDDVEAMVRAAGQYVRASEDLRPRVLEAARMQCGEVRAHRCIRRVTVFVALLAFFTILEQRGQDDYSLQPARLLVASSMEAVNAPESVAALRSGDGDWRMLDAWTKLRRQQAEALRFSL